MDWENTLKNKINLLKSALIESRECLLETQGVLVGTNNPYIRAKIIEVLGLIREALK